MGAVLLPGLTVAPGPAAGAVGLGQGAKDRLAGQGQKPAEQGVAGPSRDVIDVISYDSNPNPRQPQAQNAPFGQVRPDALPENSG